jgi:hypothetical protein
VISKELLSDVLGVKIIDCGTSSTGHFYVPENHIGYETSPFNRNVINIYELAHKCKEWAISFQELPFEVTQVYPIHYRKNENREAYVSFCIHWFYEKGKDGCMKSFIADTEPEAIFKACQWILENKDKK